MLSLFFSKIIQFFLAVDCGVHPPPQDIDNFFISRCFWCEALSTDISLKNTCGWADSPFLLENITSSAGLVGYALKSIFYWNAYFEINERLWIRSLALSFWFLTMLKIDVSSGNSFTLLFKSSGMSLIYIRKRRDLNMDPWEMPARINLHGEGCAFKTTLWNLLER